MLFYTVVPISGLVKTSVRESVLTCYSDEFKVTVVEAIRTLALKYPARQAAMLSFLGGALREEGGYEFKRAIVESIFDMIRWIEASKGEGLGLLAEFIEDCEYSSMHSLQII